VSRNRDDPVPFSTLKAFDDMAGNRLDFFGLYKIADAVKAIRDFQVFSLAIES
jgi:hypothetical protein